LHQSTQEHQTHKTMHHHLMTKMGLKCDSAFEREIALLTELSLHTPPQSVFFVKSIRTPTKQKNNSSVN